MVLFGHAAMTGAALGIRPLGPLDGPFGYWILFILSAGMTVGSIYAAYLSQTAAVPVLLTNDVLSAPRFGFSRRPTIFPLREIRSVDVMEVSGQRLLVVQGPDATLNIAQSLLPRPGDFDRLHQVLVERTRLSQA